MSWCAPSIRTAVTDESVFDPMTPNGRPVDRIPSFVLYPVFFMSGFSAILYQLVWQRSLFRIFGTNMESVTLVVTAFMFGLGLGSLAGGALSEKSRWPIPLVFGGLEFGIGLFGIMSLPLFRWIALFTSDAAGLSIGVICFIAVLIPTLFMGATLPILAAYLVKVSGNTGQSVGMLYFINTLGSAAGSFAAALLIFRVCGLSEAVALAALTNFAMAVTMIITYVKCWRTL